MYQFFFSEWTNIFLSIGWSEILRMGKKLSARKGQVDPECWLLETVEGFFGFKTRLSNIRCKLIRKGTVPLSKRIVFSELGEIRRNSLTSSQIWTDGSMYGLVLGLYRLRLYFFLFLFIYLSYFIYLFIFFFFFQMKAQYGSIQTAWKCEPKFWDTSVPETKVKS